ncbi:spore germination protein [Robertmurraya sp.]|uniref:spore germination protein n=1 Tax=Robertmurraya sp. TaxID=2837525 RepID=UPI003704CD88
MPAIVGTVNVNHISGVFNIGDVHTISPKNLAKTFAGGGSFNSGDRLNIKNAPSIINVYDSDTYEQTILSNPTPNA